MLRSPLLVFLVLVQLTSATFAQVVAGPSLASSRSIRTDKDSEFKLGTVVVKIPAPDGFTDIFDRFERARDRILLPQTSNDVFAIHVRNGLLPDLESNPDVALDFYTNVSVLSKMKAMDLSPEDFKGVVAGVKTGADHIFDLNSPSMQAAAKKLTRETAKLSSTSTGLEVTGTTNLGHFQDEKNIYSLMVLANLKLGENETSLLCSMSFIYIKKRIIFLYVYRPYRSEKDPEMVRDTTQKWTASILEKNKSQ